MHKYAHISITVLLTILAVLSATGCTTPKRAEPLAKTYRKFPPGIGVSDNPKVSGVVKTTNKGECMTTKKKPAKKTKKTTAKTKK